MKRMKRAKRKYMKILNKEDIMEIYLLLRDLYKLFYFNEGKHSVDIDMVDRFGDEKIHIMHKLYYKTLWNSLSIDQRKAILKEDFWYGVDNRYE